MQIDLSIFVKNYVFRRNQVEIEVKWMQVIFVINSKSTP